MASARIQAARSRIILVIDDDPIMRELLAHLLAAEGHTLQTAATGEQALSRLQNGFFPDVILTDMQLPGLSGAALAAQLRRAVPAACLLGMSGSEPAEESRRALDAFLLKPFSMGDFASTLQAAHRTGLPAQQRHSLPNPQPDDRPPVALDAAVYERLATTLPAAQLTELYQLTLDDIASRLARLRNALATNDLATYQREAHALKGGCGMVGALELAALAARAEAGSFHDTPAIPQFVAATERLRSILCTRFRHNV